MKIAKVRRSNKGLALLVAGSWLGSWLFILLGLGESPTGLAHAQSVTQLDSKTQLRNQPTIVAIEWSKCSGGTSRLIPCDVSACSICPCSTNPGGCTRVTNCDTLEYYRFRLDDGTVRGPFIAIPADPALVLDNKWTTQPVQAFLNRGITPVQIR